MRFKKWISMASLLMCLPFLGCANVLDSMARKTTDEAILEDARKAMNDSDWDLALEKFDELTAAKKSEVAVIEKWATAYAGKCGLNFIEYFTNLGSASLTGSTLFKYLMNAWTGETVYPEYCTLAQTKMEEISSDAADRSTNQNFFLAILGMVKVGVYLRGNLDRDGTDNLGDGTAELDPCTDDVSNLEESQATEIVTGLGLITTNLVYLTAVLGAGEIANALETVENVCALTPGACGRTDPTTVTDADRDAIRDLLKTDSANPTAPLGVGNCLDPLVAPCC